MSTAALINSTEIRSESRQIQFRRVKPSRFRQLGRKLRDVANAIAKEWNNFSLEDRETFKQIAYELIEPRRGLNNIPLKIWAKAYLLFIEVTGQKQEFYYCLESLDILVDNILDAIEREDLSYQQVLSDTEFDLRKKRWRRLPGLQGAARYGRLIFIVYHPKQIVYLVWIYTHAEFQEPQSRPPDKELKKEIGLVKQNILENVEEEAEQEAIDIAPASSSSDL